jgi:Pentapeptide repeats (8 copies)
VTGTHGLRSHESVLGFLGDGGPIWLGLVIAASLAIWAYWRALRERDGRNAKTAADIWLGIGNAIFAGGVIALVLFILQKPLRDEVDHARTATEFLSRIALTADLAGFDPPPTDRATWEAGTCAPPDAETDEDRRSLGRLAGLSFNAKNLEGARLDGMRLDGTSFRDARLVGVTFTCADLRHANLERANLQGALLTGANLAESDLRGARLDGAIWDVTSWSGATVDISTCWPREGPWKRAPLGPWMSDQGLDPTRLGERPPSYGHFCNDPAGEVIYRHRVRNEKNIPPAIGRTDVYDERRWRSSVLRALRTLANHSARAGN